MFVVSGRVRSAVFEVEVDFISLETGWEVVFTGNGSGTGVVTSDGESGAVVARSSGGGTLGSITSWGSSGRDWEWVGDGGGDTGLLGVTVSKADLECSWEGRYTSPGKSSWVTVIEGWSIEGRSVQMSVLEVPVPGTVNTSGCWEVSGGAVVDSSTDLSDVSSDVDISGTGTINSSPVVVEVGEDWSLLRSGFTSSPVLFVDEVGGGDGVTSAVDMGEGTSPGSCIWPFGGCTGGKRVSNPGSGCAGVGGWSTEDVVGGTAGVSTDISRESLVHGILVGMGESTVGSWPVVGIRSEYGVVDGSMSRFGVGFSSDGVGILHVDSGPVGLAPGGFQVDDNIEVGTNMIGVQLSGSSTTSSWVSWPGKTISPFSIVGDLTGGGVSIPFELGVGEGSVGTDTTGNVGVENVVVVVGQTLMVVGDGEGEGGSGSGDGTGHEVGGEDGASETVTSCASGGDGETVTFDVDTGDGDVLDVGVGDGDEEGAETV